MCYSTVVEPAVFVFTMVKIGATFRPVQFKRSTVHITGGLTTKYTALTTKTVRNLNGIEKEFVLLASSEAWLTYMITGQRTWSQCGMGRTTLLGDLRRNLERICNGNVCESDEHHGGGDSNRDPMLDLDCGAAPAPAQSVGPGSAARDRVRYYRNNARGQIAAFNMPARCPQEDPECTEQRLVTVHIVDRRQIWLSIDDVEWAVRYLFVQHQLRGVGLVADDDEGPWGPLAIQDAPPPAAD